ncbi:Chemotaxis protein [Rhodovastum atsumiense]|uniref:Chemotaxis protein n=1 Tax=Rhodovastum atsumiense TaxID=504468 RepID=A0A5M6J2C6_9PROT|nr:rod-binding protein [Rhodovastum atsumiense]KAA5614742.1 chemotaxis protein [Rhodovastum atsumiense]CAH2599715.1 Chemotaxis protein [Rhodovastum atsumiense]
MSSFPTLGAPGATDLATPQAARAWRAAQDFEAMAIARLIEPMFDTVDTANGMFGGGVGETAWKPFLIEGIAQRMASSGGFGLAVPIWRQMLHLQENLQSPDSQEDPA